MMKRKLLHRLKEVCGATSCIMKDELIVVEREVDGTRLLIYIIFFFFCHTCIIVRLLPVYTFLIAS